MKKSIITIILTITVGCFFLINCTTPVSAQPKTGGVLKIGMRDVVASFGVPLNLRGQARHLAYYSLDKVIQRTEKAGSYEGALAESFKLAPDKSSYTFYLRKGVKFHDGTPFNAQAVKWNWDKVHAVKDKRGIFTKVNSFEILDDHTLRANLSAWDVIMMEDFRHEAAYVISPTTYEEKGEEWCNQNPVGAGPWIFSEYVPRQKYIYKRNPDYWNKPYPYMDGIEIHVIVDAMTSQASFINGELEGLNEVDMVTAQQLISKGYKTNPFVVGGLYSMTYNTMDPKSVFSDIRMRQALEYAINKEEIGNSVGKGTMTAAYEVIRGAHDTGDPGTTPRKYDPEKAKKLIAEAGYPNGLKITLKVLDKFYGDHCVAIQHALEKVGIDLKVDIVPGPMWNEIRFTSPPPNELRWDRARGRVGDGMLVYGDSDFASDSINYPSTKRPVGFDAIMDIAMSEEDYQRRVPLMMTMEQMLYNDVFMIPLWNVWDIEFRTPDLKWDTNVRKYLESASGDRQAHFEIGWLDR